MQHLKTKELRAIEFYCDKGNKDTYLNWCQSYKSAGYSLCKQWKTNACKVHKKAHIMAAIKAKLDIIEQEQAISREYCTNKLQAIVENSNNERNKLTAISLLGDFSGYKRENAPNSEKIAEDAKRLTEEDKRYRKEYAVQRVIELGKEHIKLA